MDLVEEGKRLLIEGKDREGIDALSRALDAGAEPFLCHLSRGVAYLRAGEADKAVEDFTKAVGLRGGHAKARYYRGMASMIRGDFGGAVEDFSQALRLDSSLSTARFSRAAAYARMQRYDEATNDLRAVLPEMEASVQGAIDAYGIVRTELGRVMAELAGEREPDTLNLSEEEIAQLKRWLEEG